MGELISVNALIEEGRNLMAAGDDYYAQAGAKFHAAREAAGSMLEYRAALKRAGVAERTAQRAIQFAKDPSKAVEHRAKDVAYQTKKQRGPNSDRKYASQINDKQETVSIGELSEATRGMKAMIRKAAIAGDAGDWRTSHEKRTVAFAYFKKLLSASNLPALMGMTADEIIELIRTI